MRIGYFADGLWAHRAFDKLIEDKNIEIVFICVRYDSRDSVLVKATQDHKIPLEIHQNVNSKEFIDKIKEYKVDLIVSMSFNQIFKREFLNIAPLKTINCHAGNLPFYRGRNILNWVLINDEKEFGITVHYMDEGIDTGDIILQRMFEISDDDTYGTLLERAYIGCAEALYDAIKLLQLNAAEVISQNKIDPIGTYFGMRKIGDEIIQWNQTSREIFNFIRALSAPGPKATSYINGRTIKINQAKLVNGSHIYKNTMGQVVGKTEYTFYVKTADTMIEILEYEYVGKIKIGDRLTNG